MEVHKCPPGSRHAPMSKSLRDLLMDGCRRTSLKQKITGST